MHLKLANAATIASHGIQPSRVKRKSTERSTTAETAAALSAGRARPNTVLFPNLDSYSQLGYATSAATRVIMRFEKYVYKLKFFKRDEFEANGL